MAAGRREFLKAGTMSSLVGVAAVILTRPANADQGADAELISLCSCLDDLQRKFHATCYKGPFSMANELAAETQQALLYAEQKDPLDRIMPIRTATLAGFRARARARTLALFNEELEQDGGADGGLPDRMLWALVRDLVGEPV